MMFGVMKCCATCAFGETLYEGEVKCKNQKLILKAIEESRDYLEDGIASTWIYDEKGEPYYDIILDEDDGTFFVPSYVTCRCRHWKRKSDGNDR